MKLVNLTPHEVVLCGVPIRPDGRIPRIVTSENVDEGTLVVEGIDCRVPCVRRSPTAAGEVVDLPEPEHGVGYLVSSMVAEAGAAIGRTDLFVPDKLVRDDAGRVVGAAGLARY